MACCKVCCGCKECDEGEEGKCCCGSGTEAACCQPGEYCCSGVCQQGPCGNCGECESEPDIDVFVNGESVPFAPFGLVVCEVQVSYFLGSGKIGRYKTIWCDEEGLWHVTVQVYYTCNRDRDVAGQSFDYEWTVNAGQDGCPSGAATLVNTVVGDLADPSGLMAAGDCAQDCWDMAIPTVVVN